MIVWIQEEREWHWLDYCGTGVYMVDAALSIKRRPNKLSCDCPGTTTVPPQSLKPVSIPTTYYKNLNSAHVHRVVAPGGGTGTFYSVYLNINLYMDWKCIKMYCNLLSIKFQFILASILLRILNSWSLCCFEADSFFGASKITYRISPSYGPWAVIWQQV